MGEKQEDITLMALVEAVLFKLNEPTKLEKLSQILGESEKTVAHALDNLKETLKGRGLDLLQNGSEYSLVTTRGAASTVERMMKEQMSAEIGRAGLETLSIVLYRGPLSRREIDYIRGVNSTYILRSLMMRGLVDKISDARQPKYAATSQLLSFLGISKLEELPQFEQVKKELEPLITDSANETT